MASVPGLCRVQVWFLRGSWAGSKHTDSKGDRWNTCPTREETVQSSLLLVPNSREVAGCELWPLSLIQQHTMQPPR